MSKRGLTLHNDSCNKIKQDNMRRVVFGAACDDFGGMVRIYGEVLIRSISEIFKLQRKVKFQGFDHCHRGLKIVAFFT